MFSRFVQNFRIFSKNLPVRGFTKLSVGKGVPGPQLHANFHHYGLIILIYSSKIAKIGIFGINLSQKGIFP